MVFETFLNLVIKLAVLVQPDAQDVRQAADELVGKYFKPLHDTIMRDTTVGTVAQIVQREVISNEVTPFAQSIQGLSALYQHAFGVEYHKGSDFDRLDEVRAASLAAFHNFCTDFDLVPKYFDKGLAESVFEEIISIPLETMQSQLGVHPQSDSGYMFTFSRFVWLLIVANRVSMLKLYKGSSDASLSVRDNGLMLLSNLESSPGYARFQSRKKGTSTARNGLVLLMQQREFASMSPGPDESRCSSRGGRGLETIIVNAAGGNQSVHSGRTSNASFRQRDDASSFKGSTSQAGLLTIRGGQQSTKRLRSVSKNRSLLEKVGYDETSLEIFEKFSEPLGQLFQLYAGFGEPLNNTKMKTFKLHKLLRDSGLLSLQQNSISSRPRFANSARDRSSFTSDSKLRPPLATQQVELSPVDVDLILVKLTGSKFCQEVNKPVVGKWPQVSSSTLGSFQSMRSHTRLAKPSYMSQASLLGNKSVEGKLEFETFLKSIEMIAQKLKPNLAVGQAVEEVVLKHLLPLLAASDCESRVSGLHQAARLKEVLANEANARIMGIALENIKVYYDNYADSRGHLNFPAFFRFCADFEVFPKRCSKAKLSVYFYTLASLNKLSMEEGGDPEPNYSAQEQTEREVLDSHLFIEALALLAMDACSFGDPVQNFQSAFILFLNALDRSQGGAIVQRNLGLTRGKGGFAWNLIHGLERETVDLLNDEASHNRLSHTRLNTNRSSRGKNGLPNFTEVFN